MTFATDDCINMKYKEYLYGVDPFPNSKKGNMECPQAVEAFTPQMILKSCINESYTTSCAFPNSDFLFLNSYKPDSIPRQSKPSFGFGIGYCDSPQNSIYSATNYSEAKQSFTSIEISECPKVRNSEDFVETRKRSISRGICGSDFNGLSSTMYKPHKGNDLRWEAIRSVRYRVRELGLSHFRLLSSLGCGDIGSVHLSELIGTKTFFAIKIMDKAVLANRKQMKRALIEREILQSLDHPFLPTLYAHFETRNYSCLVMEFCPGGDLHALRQKQPGRCFSEDAARFYVAEVLLALEYLHMLGIIYRDLKPENVMVREDGHIMLSDFDLSLRSCKVSPTLVSKPSNPVPESQTPKSCMIRPSCLAPKKPRSKDPPELLAEPTEERSMSFVGTYEYLAPEIIKKKGHGCGVDWWMLGVFLYELLYGTTPFKGRGKWETMMNVVCEGVRFPETPAVGFAARDLVRGLLAKEAKHRVGSRRGAAEVKGHPFFEGVNWALIRCASPPDVPAAKEMDVRSAGNYLDIDFF